jgi:hypothetical protein
MGSTILVVDRYPSPCRTLIEHEHKNLRNKRCSGSSLAGLPYNEDENPASLLTDHAPFELLTLQAEEVAWDMRIAEAMEDAQSRDISL